MTVPTGFPLADGPLIGTWPRLLWQIAWNAGGNSTSPNHWYTVTKRLRGTWKAALSGRQYELDTAQAGTVQLKLDSLDGSFDPDNSSSFFYPNVVPYRRLRLVMMTSPSQNLAFPWMAAGTSTLSQAASVGTLATQTGLVSDPSGLSTAILWTIPSGSASGAVYGVTGAVDSWSSADCDGITVTPGLAYSVGADMSVWSGMATMPVQVQLAWYTLSGTLISTTASSSTTLDQVNWFRITASGTAPANAAFAIPRVVTQAAATADTALQATAWQVEEAATPTAYASPGGWQQLWQGFVESFTQTYDQNGKYGLTDVTGVDSLAPLSQFTLGEAMPDWVALNVPQYSFDLAATSASPDVSGGTAFADLGGSSGALDIVGSAITTGVAITSTSSAGILWNTPGPVITLTNNQASSLGSSSGATYLQPWDGTDHVMLPSSGPWSRMICFRTAVTPGTGGRYALSTLWAATNTGFLAGSGTAQDGVYLYINSSGNVGLNVQRGDGTSLAVVNSSVFVCDGNWHCAIASLSSDGKTIEVTVDDVFWYRTGSTDQHGTYTSDAIGTLLVGSSTNEQPFNGDLAWFAQWTLALNGPTRDNLARGFSKGWAEDQVATRVENILALAQFHPGSNAQFSFIGSVGSLGNVTTSGQTPLQIIQTAADSENGQFVIDHNGTPTLFGQLWRWIQSTPRVVFGENTGAGEIPYAGDVSFATDPARLYNDVQITCDGATDATDTTRVQEATDTTSQTAYFPQTLTRTVNCQSVSDGKSMADYLLSQYKDPHTRIGQITIDLAHSPTLQAQVATLAFSDLVRVMRRPALAPAKQLDGFIEQMEWSGDDTGTLLQLRLQISPASQYRYWVISAAWAALTSGIAAGVTTITTGPISDNNAIPAQYVIPSGFQMTLGYGTANAETVTVQSVQTVTAGYATVQLTLAAATTKSHSSGDLICSPNPGTIALPPSPATYPTCFDTAAEFGGTSPLFGF